MKKITLILFAIMHFFALQAISQQINIDYEEYDLDNGLHVILQKDSSTPNVIVSIMYHVGAKNENPELTGFAHFFEHLMFEGSKNIKRGEFTKYVENAGGTLNANTTNDRTFYYEMLPSNYLELGIWLESERLRHATVDSIGIQTQKKVVIEEKKQTRDNVPYGTILYEIFSRAYTVHPYRWETIGDEDHIMNAKDEDFLAFYEHFYVPNNAVLVIVGDFDPIATKEMINNYFGDIPRGKGEIYRPTQVEPIKYEQIVDTVYDDIQIPALIHAYHSPAMGTKDFYAVEMLSALLSAGESARLRKELVHNTQLALEVVSIPLPFEHPSLSIVFALPNGNIEIKQLEKALENEMDRVRNELISEKEFQAVRNQFESKVVQSNRTIENRAINLADAYTYFKNTARVNSELDRYLEITREDIKDAANKYFRKDNRVILYFLPKNHK